MHDHKSKYAHMVVQILFYYCCTHNCPPVLKQHGFKEKLYLLIRNWTRTLTEGHDANATVGYADYSADFARWEAAAAKVASSV